MPSARCRAAPVSDAACGCTVPLARQPSAVTPSFCAIETLKALPPEKSPERIWLERRVSEVEQMVSKFNLKNEELLEQVRERKLSFGGEDGQARVRSGSVGSIGSVEKQVAVTKPTALLKSAGGIVEDGCSPLDRFIAELQRCRQKVSSGGENVNEGRGTGAVGSTIVSDAQLWRGTTHDMRLRAALDSMRWESCGPLMLEANRSALHAELGIAYEEFCRLTSDTALEKDPDIECLDNLRIRLSSSVSPRPVVPDSNDVTLESAVDADCTAQHQSSEMSMTESVLATFSRTWHQGQDERLDASSPSVRGGSQGLRRMINPSVLGRFPAAFPQSSPEPVQPVRRPWSLGSLRAPLSGLASLGMAGTPVVKAQAACQAPGPELVQRSLRSKSCDLRLAAAGSDEARLEARCASSRLITRRNPGAQPCSQMLLNPTSRPAATS